MLCLSLYRGVNTLWSLRWNIPVYTAVLLAQTDCRLETHFSLSWCYPQRWLTGVLSIDNGSISFLTNGILVDEPSIWKACPLLGELCKRQHDHWWGVHRYRGCAACCIILDVHKRGQLELQSMKLYIKPDSVLVYLNHKRASELLVDRFLITEHEWRIWWRMPILERLNFGRCLMEIFRSGRLLL